MILRLNFPGHPLSFLLHLYCTRLGTIPLPPYLKRTAESSDAERYQTIYAKESGSVAAPTAGLHFSDKLLQDLSEKVYKPYTSHCM